jgi:ribonucleoside-diphosphate reductase alpha chain
MDSFATSVSLALQYGVPLDVLVDKFSHTRFEPSGFTGNPDIPIATSISDYVFRWLKLKFVKPEGEVEANAASVMAEASTERAPAQLSLPVAGYQNQTDAPPCHSCGTIMVRNGACYKCTNCGSTSGCS